MALYGDPPLTRGFIQKSAKDPDPASLVMCAVIVHASVSRPPVPACITPEGLRRTGLRIQAAGAIASRRAVDACRALLELAGDAQVQERDRQRAIFIRHTQ